MRLGVTEYIDCAHLLPGHPKCGQIHGHTYQVEVTVEGELKDGMVVDFADLKAQVRAVLGRYDHRHWNDFLEQPTVERICERLASELAEKAALPLRVRVYEGHGKWAETDASPPPGSRPSAPRLP